MFAYNHHKKSEEEASSIHVMKTLPLADNNVYRKKPMLGEYRTGSLMLRGAHRSSTSTVPADLSPGSSYRATSSLQTLSLEARRTGNLSTSLVPSTRAVSVSTLCYRARVSTLTRACRGRKDRSSLEQWCSHRLRPQGNFCTYHANGVDNQQTYH